MIKRILVDAAHPEEVRLVVTKNGIVEEFDYQTSSTKTSQGNIYLGKVVRVEPALQAIFVDYGKDRNGFLPFSEIHPDYYQIPQEDKKKILEQMKRAYYGKKRRHLDAQDEDDQHQESEERCYDDDEKKGFRENTPENGEEERKEESLREYKVNEVIKKDQVVLVQVVKEERGNKGASLTTYINLVGKYTVYMPNNPTGAGVSKKIYDNSDRERLKLLVKELCEKCNEKGSVIIRTSGAQKTKVEIRKDFDYLCKLWDNIRRGTLASNAPAFIYEEGDIVKRSIRDLYNPSIEEVIVDGKAHYDDAQNFMKLILPRHASKVKRHNNKVPIFSEYKIEQQIASLYNPIVNLKSGGHIVISPTEALVAIDINSGKATGERSVEDTALKTNLEAAEEVALQMRLRDLGGLIVIDFIDMVNPQHRKQVEKAMKRAIQDDHAKIKISYISQFGLMEISRQRIRKNFLETNTSPCSQCQGSGRTRSLHSTATALIRAIENEVLSNGESMNVMEVSASQDIMIYVLNNSRISISKLEKKYDLRIVMKVSQDYGPDRFYIDMRREDNEEEQALSGIDSAEMLEDEMYDQGKDILPISKQAPPVSTSSGKQRRSFHGGNGRYVVNGEGRSGYATFQKRRFYNKKKVGNMGAHANRSAPVTQNKTSSSSFIKRIWDRIVN